MKTREEVLAILRRAKPELAREFEVTALGVFGSVARGQATDGSDVDVVVQLAHPNVFLMVHLKERLESLLDSRVDVLRYRESLSRTLRSRIDREAIYV